MATGGPLGVSSGLPPGWWVVEDADVVTYVVVCDPVGRYLKAPMPVISRPTISVCMVSVPSKVWMASRSTMCRMTW